MRSKTLSFMKPTPLAFFSQLLSKEIDANPLIFGVSIDSRNVKPGDLFFALPGKKVDGHDFLPHVAEKGGKAAIVCENYAKEDFGLTLIRVPNVLEALQTLGRKVLQSRSCKVIAITGSVGKTTTKEFTKSLLQEKYKVFATPASYNTESTVPLSILMSDGDEDIIILEMGMCRPGEIATLVSIAPPDIALLTTVAFQHAVEFEEGLKGISREKATLFSHPKTSLRILHHEIPYFDEIIKVGTCPKATFSLQSEKADYFLTFIADNIIRISDKHSSYEFPFHLPMKVLAHNLLASCAIARALDVPWETISKVIPSLKLPAMRFEKVEKQGILFINDAYNANTDSLKAALENLPKPLSSHGKKIAVLSEMNALGSYSEEGHTIVAKTALSHADLLLCIGSRCETMIKVWKNAKKEAHFFNTKEELIASLKNMAKPGDVVLLKGARSYSLDKILDHF